MQYLLLIYDDEKNDLKMTQPQLGEVMQAYMAYTEKLRTDGVYLGSNRLRPVETASSIRIRDGKTNVMNGPFAETREQLGGYYLIDVPDEQKARHYAALCPGAKTGTMEVRPVWAM
ncbi:MAG: YciI family protein [Alphaproteobacteria bacterium]|nr:YciI family protein [Alphaproteobacteria bacterium]MBL6936258.1 YciI family protein [Alphaproteobacteria bacterium]MBL7098691.1 YciI family protein [Alphaproteobacteria bacterium]